MSQLDFSDDGPRRRRGLGCVVALVVLAVIVGAGYFGVQRGLEALDGRFDTEPVADYPGPGTGEVVYEVQPGDTPENEIATALEQQDVVQSAEAFIEAARADERSSGIQAGFYELRQQMSAQGALEVLVDPDNILQTSVTIPEGLTVDDTVAQLARGTDFGQRAFRRALRGDIGLPEYADGNPEGYLFPATYAFPPNATPESMLTTMVDRWRQAADEANLDARAEELGYTADELMIIASLVEAEASRDQDRPKVARVIYNRLEGDETDGLLQIDSTLNYINSDIGARATFEDLQQESEYNTYQNPGLPPSPIESPGDAAIEAAANPADGPWFYYVTVNLRTGETKFAEDYDTFLGFRRELDEYCATQSDAC
ncbi:endolytic transglycosylase MltG [Nocardioidaceae bacterium]|nr:endolytic transglycosylase MltG [Nocardioidaceae bacterium]